MEVEPLDPAQAAAYADPANMYYPRGQEEQTPRPPPHCTRAIMARNATAKLVYRAGGGVSELYDLAADPLELRNLHGTAGAASLQAELTAALLEWLVQTSDVTSLSEDPRGLPPPPANPPFPWPPVPVAARVGTGRGGESWAASAEGAESEGGGLRGSGR